MCQKLKLQAIYLNLLNISLPLLYRISASANWGEARRSFWVLVLEWGLEMIKQFWMKGLETGKPSEAIRFGPHAIGGSEETANLRPRSFSVPLSGYKYGCRMRNSPNNKLMWGRPVPTLAVPFYLAGQANLTRAIINMHQHAQQFISSLTFRVKKVKYCPDEKCLHLKLLNNTIEYTRPSLLIELLKRLCVVTKRTVR